MYNLINVIILSLLSSIGWGLAPYYDKKSLNILNNDYTNVFLLKYLIIGIITFVLFIIKPININTISIKPSIKYIIFGALSTMFAGICFFKALSISNNTVLVVLISYVIPLLLVTTLSKLALKETINNGMIIGLFITIIGIILFVYNTP